MKKNEAKGKTGFGKIRIEYEVNGNVIRVYNSSSVCSLVINGEIADQYFGIVGSNFCLKGQIDAGEKTIPVEARMGQVNMRLYCDGLLVAKKFMAFG